MFVCWFLFAGRSWFSIKREKGKTSAFTYILYLCAAIYCREFLTLSLQNQNSIEVDKRFFAAYVSAIIQLTLIVRVVCRLWHDDGIFSSSIRGIIKQICPEKEISSTLFFLFNKRRKTKKKKNDKKKRKIPATQSATVEFIYLKFLICVCVRVFFKKKTSVVSFWFSILLLFFFSYLLRAAVSARCLEKEMRPVGRDAVW